MSALTFHPSNVIASVWSSAPLPPFGPKASWWLAAGLAVFALLAVAIRRRLSPRLSAGHGAVNALAWWVFDLTFVFIAVAAVPRLRFGLASSPALLVTLISWRAAIAGLSGIYCSTPSPVWRRLLSWIIVELAFAVGAVWLSRAVAPPVTVAAAGSAVAAHGILGLIWLAWSTGLPPRMAPAAGEATRFGLLLALALVLTQPWFSPYLVGTGDGRLYYETLQDFLNQLHAGIWHPWVSQSEVAPFGAVFPFRFATYHYYFAALLDALTGRSLTTYAVQHLTIILSFIVGGWSMYAVLRRLVPASPWLACVFAAFYLASPAWLGPLYGFTMIFTIMTLPFIPFALLGAWPAFGAKNVSSAVVHGAVLAASWHAHLPVGFWVSVTVALSQVVALLLARSGWKVLRFQILSWSVCAILCSGLWYSVASLHYGSPRQEVTERGEAVVRMIKTAFPASLFPASPLPAALSDIQLGYALTIALIGAGVAATLRARPRQILVWLVPAALFTILLLPIPWVTRRLWDALPVAALNLTGTWPVQRMIGPLAGAATLVGLLGFSFLAGRSSRWRWIVGVVTCALALWSATEAAKYLRRGQHTVLPAALSDDLSRRENSPLMLNWLAFHNHIVPPFYLAQTTYDARLYNRIWSENRTNVTADNYAYVLAAGSAQPPIRLTASTLAPTVWRLLPRFDFQGGQRFLLELIPTAQTVPGVFNLTSADLVRSETTLTPNGPPVTQPIWTTPAAMQMTEMTYLPSNPALAEKAVDDFLRYRLIPYDPAKLPVAITSYVPFLAQVTSSAPGWVETHRIFTDGYRAFVNGQSAPIEMSADGRLMVKIPAGSSQVRLDYVGTTALRATFGLMGGAWVLFAVWSVICGVRWWLASFSKAV